MREKAENNPQEVVNIAAVYNYSNGVAIFTSYESH
jgi:hypothetical protein